MNNNDTPNEYTPEKEDKTIIEKLRSFYPLSDSSKKTGLIGGVVIVVVLILAIATAFSLPGEALHGIKTGVFEELNESVQFGVKNKAEAQVSNMEARLEEVKKLSKKENIDPDAIEALRSLINKHSSRLSALANSSEEEFSREDALVTLSSFASVAAAIETVSENDPKLSAFGEEVEDIRRDAVNLYKDKVDNFVERSPLENIYSYIQARLQEVADKLNDPDLREETIDDAQTYIERVGPAVSELDFPRAIAAIAEAQRFIEIALYVGDMPEAATTTPSSSTGTSTPQDATSTDQSETGTSPDAQFTFPE